MKNRPKRDRHELGQPVTGAQANRLAAAIDSVGEAKRALACQVCGGKGLVTFISGGKSCLQRCPECHA